MSTEPECQVSPTAGQDCVLPKAAPRAPSGVVPQPAAQEPWVAVVGNPNVGKTSLFNRLTGQTARVGNYPGITVERREGRVDLGNGRGARLLDVPGAYSLSARSADEQIAADCALGLNGQPRPDLVVAVVDAGQLGRNLYLVSQLLEAGLPLVVVLNMIDEVREDPPSASALAKLLGVPCVATDARRGIGLDELKRSLATALTNPQPGKLHLPYPSALLSDLNQLTPALPAEWHDTPDRGRALALWALTSVEPDDELRSIPASLRQAVDSVREKAQGRDLDLEIAQTRYAFIDRVVPELHNSLTPHPPKRKASERIDKILLHPVLGFAIFTAVMVVVFQSLFSWSDPLIHLIEAAMGLIQQGARGVLPPGVLRDLVCEGVLGGVGNVVVFLPQILLLFLFIGLLEDSGYMARVAFLMDRVMRALGLHGRAFVPLLSGYACAVPAILATRTMERQRDRLLTMLVIPLMTCSARLPVYTLIIGALFPPTQIFGLIPVQGLLLVALYLISMVAALVVAAVLGRNLVKGRRIPLILELPPYRWPSWQVTLRSLGERAGSFLKEAGTVILACTVVLWFLLSFPRSDVPTGTAPVNDRVAISAAASPPDSSVAQPAPKRQIEASYGGRAGKWLEPLVKPLGFDWKIGVGLVGAFAAREVFVSTMGLVYGIGDAEDNDAPLRDRMRAETRPDGTYAYSPLVGLSLLVFFAFACQCMSTLAVVARESRSWRWPAFVFGYTLVLAWVSSFVVYQGGRLLGF